MGRQPYIPLYVGDYLKDTRVLPLNVRGAWIDLILFMWDNPVRGEIVGTLDEVARMIGCSTQEAEFALNLLKQKKTADIDLLPTGEWKIVSRKMKRDAQLSEKRSTAGKNGVKAKVAKANASTNDEAKPQANSDIEYDIDNENIIEIGVKNEKWIGISAKYAGEKPRRVYDLAAYFASTGQLQAFKGLGWDKRFAGFMDANPARVYDNDAFVYNSFSAFCKSNNEQPKINGKTVAFDLSKK